LKRRNVLRVSAVYLAVAWLLLQIVDTIAPIIDLPISAQKILLLLLTIGFPVAVILAWILELTPEGLQRDSGSDSPNPSLARWLDKTIIVVLALAVVYFVAEKTLFSETAPEIGVGRSVAVLPLANLSQDEATAPFALGIHDDLLTHLSRIKALRTVSRTSVMQYQGTTKTIPEIAKELGVATVLAGGVQRSGDRVRINVQLIAAAKDETLWAETYDRELTAANVFDIQSDIARMIANRLRATLTADEEQRLDAVPTQSIAALDSYFIGKQMLELRTLESLTAAVEHFESVVEIDPDFALAWSGLADAYMLLPEYSPTVDRKMVGERSTYAVARALELDSSLPFVSSSAAWSKLIHEYDWRGAEDAFRRALEVEADNTTVLHWLSHTLSWQGQHDEALEVARLTVAIEPFSRLMNMNLAYILIDAGQYDEALSIAKELRLREPSFAAVRRNLYLHELRSGRIEDGAQSFENYNTATGGDPVAAGAIASMFIAYANSGEVGQITDELIAAALLGSEDLPQIIALVGDAEGTLNALRIALDQRSGSRSVLSMKINPAYDFVRDEPRFQEMLREIGLADL
jgi:TolB-like protein/Tfp pilus assembly protein PilF